MPLQQTQANTASCSVKCDVAYATIITTQHTMREKSAETIDNLRIDCCLIYPGVHVIKNVHNTVLDVATAKKK